MARRRKYSLITVIVILTLAAVYYILGGYVGVEHVRVVTPYGEFEIEKTDFIYTDVLYTGKWAMKGVVVKVVDGDTIDVEGIGRIRMADINAPELSTKEGQKAKEFVKSLCLGKTVYLDIDDEKVVGKYGRIIAVVYLPFNKTHLLNLNAYLVKEGYAEVKDFPNEFKPEDWEVYVQFREG